MHGKVSTKTLHSFYMWSLVSKWWQNAVFSVHSGPLGGLSWPHSRHDGAIDPRLILMRYQSGLLEMLTVPMALICYVINKYPATWLVTPPSPCLRSVLHLELATLLYFINHVLIISCFLSFMPSESSLPHDQRLPSTCLHSATWQCCCPFKDDANDDGAVQSPTKMAFK